jgi:3-hydroxybutyrate dehydrogenase
MTDRVELQGKRALITGGGRGIGEACARALANAGAHVIVAGRSAQALQRVAGELAGEALIVDLSSRLDVDRALATLVVRGVDIIVNNAGIALSAAAPDTTDAMWDQMMEVNVASPFRIIRALLPAMMANKWGRIINIASNAGVSGYQYTSGYCASKHALVGLTRGLAMDIARSGVTVNALCPGWVATDMADAAINNIASKTGRSPEQARDVLAAMSPQRRLMEVDEVAYAAVMLCGAGARGIHGQTLVIDGGQILK